VELKKLFLEPTAKTPQIELDPSTGELIFKGRSIPENAIDLYENVFKWVTHYTKEPKQITNLRLNLEYFNTASSIWLAKIVKALCSINEPENTLIIHLYFNADEFESMELEELKDNFGPVIDMIANPIVNIGIKIYSLDDNGEILKESMVLI
jgi:hypothetical protein